MNSICRHLRRIATTGLLAVPALCGCAVDDSVPKETFIRVPVAGTVTFDGAPLPKGTIQLDPTEGTNGPTASGEIVDGKFAIDKALGPVAGKYNVSITSRPPKVLKENEQPGGATKLDPETIPAKYNTATQLHSEVPAEGSKTLEFALKK